MLESLNNEMIGARRLRVEMIGRARYFDQRDFALYLDNALAFRGRFNAGRPSINVPGWIDGEFVENAFAETLDATSLLAEKIGALIPPGGRLWFAYEAFDGAGDLARETRAALHARVPLIATPLGYLLFRAGCWSGMRDWDFPEGGNEGPRKLQGNKPANDQHARASAMELVNTLESFARQRVATEIEHRAQARIGLLLPALRSRAGGS